MSAWAPGRYHVFLPEARPHQRALLDADARLKLAICGVQSGKTTAGIMACLEGHGPGWKYPGVLQGATVWWVSSSFPLADLAWRDFKRAMWQFGRIRESERRITCPSGGSITVKSGEKPEGLRAATLDGLFLDELGDQHEETWFGILRARIAVRRGWAILMGTVPRAAKAHWVWSRLMGPLREKPDPDWALFDFPSSVNMSPEELATVRKDVGSYVFAREYEAQWVTAGGGLFKREWFRHYDLDGGRLRLGTGVSYPRESLTVFATMDPASSLKTHADYTVLGVWGQAPGGELLLLDLYRERLEGPGKIKLLDAACEKHRVAAVWVERMGDLISMARAAGIPARELSEEHAVSKDKVERAEPAMAWCEAGRVWWPRAVFPSGALVSELENELEAFPSPDHHDDQVDVLAYAVRHLTARRVSGLPAFR